MTFEDFIKEFKDEFSHPYIEERGVKPYNWKKDKTRWVMDAEWTTGGMTGGNCWGSDANQSVDADDEPELEGLDRVLEKVAPTLTYLHYRKICKLLTTRDHTEYEYYGNYYHKRTKMLDARQLYDMLVELGYIGG